MAGSSPSLMINQGSPFASKLLFAWLPQAPNHNLADGSEAVGGTLTVGAATSYGASMVTGASGYKSFRNRGSLLGPVSAVAWIYYDASGAGTSRRVICSPADQTATDTPSFVLGLHTDNKVVTAVAGVTAAFSASALSVGSHTIGMSWSGVSGAGTTQIYIDGVPDGSVTGTASGRVAGAIELGRYNNNYNQAFQSPMSAVCVWDRLLTPAEFTALATDPFAMYQL